jgi:hypothetical protein
MAAPRASIPRLPARRHIDAEGQRISGKDRAKITPLEKSLDHYLEPRNQSRMMEGQAAR